jgi:hypothetical protein
VVSYVERFFINVIFQAGNNNSVSLVTRKLILFLIFKPLLDSGLKPSGATQTVTAHCFKRFDTGRFLVNLCTVLSLCLSPK